MGIAPFFVFGASGFGQEEGILEFDGTGFGICAVEEVDAVTAVVRIERHDCCLLEAEGKGIFSQGLLLPRPDLGGGRSPPTFLQSTVCLYVSLQGPLLSRSTRFETLLSLRHVCLDYSRLRLDRALF